MTVASGVKVAGFSHVAICVRDVEVARRFYCDVLGFAELPRPDFGFPGAWLQVGNLQLHLMETRDAPPAPEGIGAHFALHLPTEEFGPTIDALRAVGVKFHGEPSKRVDFGREVLAAFVTDPSGNLIELTNVGPVDG